MTPPADEACTENIAFLRFLHEVPAPSSRNEPGHLPLRHEDYALSFNRERQFVGACAFLSCIRADTKNVSAVCLQEVRGSESLSLLIAVNKRGFDAGRVYLQKMKRGFERVFQELCRVETADGADVQAKLFDAVITMCSERILQRLGLEGINGRPGKPITDTLEKVVNNLREHQPPSMDVTNQTRKVMRLIGAWSKHRVAFRLGNIVDGLHDFTRSPVWRKVVASPPALDLQQSQIDKLVREIRKLARYRDVARYLYRTAKRYPIARFVHVVPIDLPRTLFERTALGDYAAELEPFFESFRVGRFSIAQASKLLKTHPSAAKTAFATSARSIREESGIHAEVQLLVHCDRYLRGLKPRVICSNKQACFLCNLAIDTHGKFYTPYSHGRLYPGWRLPKICGDQFIGQLNTALRERAHASLLQMKREHKAIGYKYPDESASHTLVISSTTLVEEAEPDRWEAREGGPIDDREHSGAGIESPSPQQAEATGNENRDDTGGGAGSQSSLVGPPPSTQGEDTIPDGITTNIEEVEGRAMPDTGPRPLEEGNVNTASIGEKCNGHILQRGKPISRLLTSGPNTSKLFFADNFDLVVDRGTPSPSSPGTQHSPKRLTCDLCWITAEEASHILGQSGSSIVDIDTLDKATLPLDGPTTFFLRHSDRCVLRVSIDTEMPR